MISIFIIELLDYIIIKPVLPTTVAGYPQFHIMDSNLTEFTCICVVFSVPSTFITWVTAGRQLIGS